MWKSDWLELECTKSAQSFSYSLSIATCWMGMNGCLLYSVAGKVLGSWRDSLGDGRGEQGGFMGGSCELSLLSWAFPHSHFCVCSLLQTLTWWIACCMPCGSVARELLKCQSAAPFLCYSYTSSPNPTLISQFASFRSWADYHSPSLHYVPHAQTIHLGNRGTRLQAGCSTFSLFLCPLASSSPPLIGGRWCPEGLWISAPTSS